MTPRINCLKRGALSSSDIRVRLLGHPSCNGFTPLSRSILRSTSTTATEARTKTEPSTEILFDKTGEGEGRRRQEDLTGSQKFSRLSTATLLRSVILGKILKTPWIYYPGLRILNILADSKSPLLDADKNFLIRLVVHPLIYKQFCAGRNKAEVQQTITQIKQYGGYSGVILCYSKEIMAGKGEESKGQQSIVEDAHQREEQDQVRIIKEWCAGNLASLSNVSEGDYIGVKYTGAGPSVSQALKDGRDPPAALRQALYDICDQARDQNKRLWIDAEQQIYHPTIDKWTVDLMQKYNRGGQIVVLTTIQAYLKSARNTVEWYLKQAQAEGWTLGIKLVRGAYIESDIRSRIHDTKADTDASYDGIAHDLIAKSWKGFTGPGGEKEHFPQVLVFLAGHNTNSIRKAVALVRRLAEAGELTEPVHYGQLQGMADDIGGELLTLGERLVKDSSITGDNTTTALVAAPRVYKCLTWGSVKDCLHYLVRRAVENQNAAEKLGEGLKDMQTELWRRLVPWK